VIDQIIPSPETPYQPRSTACAHAHRRIYRVPWRTGQGEHLAELCSDCGANVRGAGVWVPRAEVPGDPAALPVAPGRMTTSRQLSLFDGHAVEEGGHG
jgi:hypothetical protein